jgi:drug/metabolite transporter (DMT)-like permease
MENTKRAYLELHIAVLLFGATAILGDLIDLSALMLIWWRMLITIGVYFAFTTVVPQIRLLPRAVVVPLALNGIVLALHWLTFYGAIKLANASVALVALATTSFFSSIIEPLSNRQRVKWYEVTLGVLMIPGIWLIESDLSASMSLGFWVGLLSALLCSVFSIVNKRYISRSSPLTVSVLNLSFGWLFLTALLPVLYFFSPDEAFFPPHALDWLWLALLSLFCTNLAFWLAMRSLRYLSAFATNLTVNLEPIYGIVLAVVILKENKHLSATFYIGCALILLAVLSYPMLKKWATRAEQQIL